MRKLITHQVLESDLTFMLQDDSDIRCVRYQHVQSWVGEREHSDGRTYWHDTFYWDTEDVKAQASEVMQHYGLNVTAAPLPDLFEVALMDTSLGHIACDRDQTETLVGISEVLHSLIGWVTEGQPEVLIKEHPKAALLIDQLALDFEAQEEGSWLADNLNR